MKIADPKTLAKSMDDLFATTRYVPEDWDVDPDGMPHDPDPDLEGEGREEVLDLQGKQSVSSVVISAIKHKKGKHNQATHGRSGPRKPTSLGKRSDGAEVFDGIDPDGPKKQAFIMVRKPKLKLFVYDPTKLSKEDVLAQFGEKSGANKARRTPDGKFHSGDVLAGTWEDGEIKFDNYDGPTTQKLAPQLDELFPPGSKHQGRATPEDQAPKPAPTPSVSKSSGPSMVPWKPVMSREQADKWAEGGAWDAPVWHITSKGAKREIMDKGLIITPGSDGDKWGTGIYLSTGEKDSTPQRYYKKQLHGGGTQLEARVRPDNLLTVDGDAFRDSMGKKPSDQLDPFDVSDAIKRAVAKSNPSVFDNPDPGWRTENVLEEQKEKHKGFRKEMTRLLKEWADAHPESRHGIPPYDEEKEMENKARELSGVDPAFRNSRGSAALIGARRMAEAGGYDVIRVKADKWNKFIGGDQLIVADPKKIVVVDPDAPSPPKDNPEKMSANKEDVSKSVVDAISGSMAPGAKDTGSQELPRTAPSAFEPDGTFKPKKIGETATGVEVFNGIDSENLDTQEFVMIRKPKLQMIAYDFEGKQARERVAKKYGRVTGLKEVPMDEDGNYDPAQAIRGVWTDHNVKLHNYDGEITPELQEELKRVMPPSTAIEGVTPADPPRFFVPGERLTEWPHEREIREKKERDAMKQVQDLDAAPPKFRAFAKDLNDQNRRWANTPEEISEDRVGWITDFTDGEETLYFESLPHDRIQRPSGSFKGSAGKRLSDVWEVHVPYNPDSADDPHYDTILKLALDRFPGATVRTDRGNVLAWLGKKHFEKAGAPVVDLGAMAGKSADISREVVRAIKKRDAL